ELGQIRFEANVSVRPAGSDELRKRVEMKNLNSFRTVVNATEYEIARQTEAYENGEQIVQETRLWDDVRGVTVSMRSKEDSHDYRYFPDPDLVPMVFTQEYLASVYAALPELPTARRNRFIEQYGLPEYDARLLTSEKTIADFVDAVIALGISPKVVSNWTMGELMRSLNENSLPPENNPITPEMMAELLRLLENGKINNGQARQVFTEMFSTGDNPTEIVKARGLEQISDTGELGAIIDAIITANPEPCARYSAGEDKPLAFLVGQIMRQSKGKANAALVNELLNKKLRP
ncbi:MAG: Asp-tRNA(Asn)/Glu-tRNA(Gln) amidotransferase GatCAB subunit B, partial [bacterium]